MLVSVLAREIEAGRPRDERGWDRHGALPMALEVAEDSSTGRRCLAEGSRQLELRLASLRTSRLTEAT
jgi:hypothetical protein